MCCLMTGFFHKHNDFEVHPCGRVSVLHTFSWPSHIPLYGWSASLMAPGGTSGICISPVIHDVGRFFHVLTDHLCIFLGEVSMQIPLCIFKSGYSFCSLPCSPTSSSLGGHDRDRKSSVSLYTCREVTTLIGRPDTLQHQMVPQLLLPAPCGQFPTQQ